MTKLQVFENFFNKIQHQRQEIKDDFKVEEAITLICDYAYANNQGFGMLSKAQMKTKLEEILKKMEEF